MPASRVAIIGAGPAGLVSAKTLRDAGFEVTIFESKNRIGGIWALETHDQRAFISDQTPSNLSRFSVSFTDLAWNHSSSEDSNFLENPPPLFPKAWQINRYLQEYCKRFIPESLLRLRCRIIKAEIVKDAAGASSLWRVTVEDARIGVCVETYDKLLVATGIFSQARPLQFAVPSTGDESHTLPISVIHSSHYRNLDDLFPSRSTETTSKKILVIGGANSGGEAAAAVALHLSDSQWSPTQHQRERYRNCKIIHVVSRPFYGIPPFLEYESKSRSYVPLDWKMYDLSKKPAGPMKPSIGVASPEKIHAVHGFLQDVIGSDQSDLGWPALVSSPGQDRGTPYAALSEQYNEFVRSGLIEVVAGRVDALEDAGKKSVSAHVTQGACRTIINDVNAIIYATGYTPCPAIDFLSDEVKSLLEFDPSNMRVPLLLDQWQTSNSSVPQIAFVGWYEGPFWPIMEMQARLITRRWSGGEYSIPDSIEDRQSMIRLRGLIQEKSSIVPQYWFTDYAAQMESMATTLDLARNDRTWREREGCPSPARYLPRNSSNSADAVATMDELIETWRACLVGGKYTARAAFRALHGKWSFSRFFDNIDQCFRCEGIASFHPRFATSESCTRTIDYEYLYIETYDLPRSDRASEPVEKRYVYRYSEQDDRLSVWSVKLNDGLEADTLLYDLAFHTPADARAVNACIAVGKTSSPGDSQLMEYRLPMSGVSLFSFEITSISQVPGEKSTVSTTFSRPPRQRIN